MRWRALMREFPEGSVSEDRASPRVLQEAKEREELTVLTWRTSQGSASSPSRFARVSMRTSMCLEDGISAFDCAEVILGNSTITNSKETIAAFTFHPPSDRPERTESPVLGRAMTDQLQLEPQRAYIEMETSNPRRATHAYFRFRVRVDLLRGSLCSTPRRTNPSTTRRRFQLDRGFQKSRHSPDTQQLE